MYCTLRPETWDCFQRIHGHRPISHSEWFCAKLAQFFDILLYDVLTIEEPNGQPRKLQQEELLDQKFTVVGSVGSTQPDDLEQVLAPELCAEYDWYGLVQKVIGSPTDRAGAVQGWLTEQRKAQDGGPTEPPRGGWWKNQERDRIILNCLNRGMAPDLVCIELDKLTIPTLPALQTQSIHRWKDGWVHPKTRNAIQQLFSKLHDRKRPVKPPAVSN